MSLDKDIKLRNYIAHCDNAYSVVNTISSIARDKYKECNGYILDSEALTWVIQNTKPNHTDINRGNNMQSSKIPYNMMTVDDILCNIEDVEVKESVKESILRSHESNYLLYYYKDIKDEFKKSRVRIIVKMIWDKLIKGDIDNGK